MCMLSLPQQMLLVVAADCSNDTQIINQFDWSLHMPTFFLIGTTLNSQLKRARPYLLLHVKITITDHDSKFT